ncbi:Tethering factor for nuclear proteasome sts1 [Colletotrichum asianum]
MVLFNRAVCVAAGCALTAPNASDPIPTPKITFPTNATCGEVTVFYTGLAAYLPLVLSRGFDPVQTDIALRNDTANLVKAGFNVYVLFQGPDQPASNIADRMKGRRWGVTGVGWGIRNSTMLELRISTNTARPSHSLLWFSIEARPLLLNRVPLRDDCTGKPGTLYAYEENCPPELCEKTTVVTSGSLEELLQGIPQ